MKLEKKCIIMKTDLSYLLSMSGGDDSLIFEMIEIFNTQVEEMREEMQKLESEGNFDALSKLAHKAKSSVAIMGMNSLSDSLKELEILARDMIRTDSYKAYIDRFVLETQEATIELNEYVRKRT